MFSRVSQWHINVKWYFEQRNQYTTAARRLSSLLTVTNQCPWCLSTFSSTLSAEHHVANMFKSNNCPVDRSIIPHVVLPPPNLVCRMCDQPAADLAQLNWHLRTQHPGPTTLSNIEVQVGDPTGRSLHDTDGVEATKKARERCIPGSRGRGRQGKGRGRGQSSAKAKGKGRQWRGGGDTKSLFGIDSGLLQEQEPVGCLQQD